MEQEEVKIQAFEYVLYKLVAWYKNAYPKSEDNDISVLKALKLLFFISAVDTTKDSSGTLLDDVFNNFVAMPYGHVESDVYSIIKRRRLQQVEINNHKTSISNTFDLDGIEVDLRKRIDMSVNKLQSINFNLIKYSSFNLVDLSHTWYSWQYFYNMALATHCQSHPIQNDYIKSEEKIYTL